MSTSGPPPAASGHAKTRRVSHYPDFRFVRARVSPARSDVRCDGGPRLHPLCPVLAGGRLFAAIPRSSPKGWDLRCVIHALPGPDGDDFCVRAVAVVGASGVGGMIESVAEDPLFAFGLEQVDVARWFDIGRPGTRAARQQWRAASPG